MPWSAAFNYPNTIERDLTLVGTYFGMAATWERLHSYAILEQFFWNSSTNQSNNQIQNAHIALRV